MKAKFTYFNNMPIEDQIRIYEEYLGEINSLPHNCCSPLPDREDDSNPSFGIFMTRDAKQLLWKDFCFGTGNVYSFIREMEKHDRPNVSLGFFDVKKIAERILGTTTGVASVRTLSKRAKDILHKAKVKKTKEPSIRYTSDYKDFELAYWAKRGITRERLLERRIYAFRGLFWGKFDAGISSTPTEPTFVYLYNDDPMSWKMYSPHAINRKNKWKSWNTSIIPYEGVVDQSKPIVAAFSSTKDAEVFYNNLPDNLKAITSVIAAIAEGNYKGILNELDKSLHGKEIICIFDFDWNEDKVKNVKKGEEHLADLIEKSKGRIKEIKLPVVVDNYLYSKSIKDFDEIVINLSKHKSDEIFNEIIQYNKHLWERGLKS